MKKRHILLAVVVLVCVSAATIFVRSCRDKRLSHRVIAEWLFEGNTNDVSGHGHYAYPQGLIRYGLSRLGGIGKSLYLDGHSSLIVNDSSDLRFTGQSAFSISVWVRADSSEGGIIGKGPADTALPGYSLGLKGGHP